MRPLLQKLQGDFFLILLFLFVSLTTQASEPDWPYPMKKFVYSDAKLQKFFDLDKNKIISRNEWSLIATQKRFGWVLAASKTKKKFDANNDSMLGPYEYHLYKKGRKNEEARFIPLPIKQ